MTYKREFILGELCKNLARDFHVLQILIGPRQVGKTTTVEQFLKEWPHSSRYATADQLAPPNADFIQAEWEEARRLPGQRPLLVIDEVQKIPRWSEAVKKLHDEDHRDGRALRVILLGSSSLLLQKGLTESLAGRFQLLRCPHWSFRECRDAFGWDLDRWLFFGGYPAGAALVDDAKTWRSYIRDSLLETVIGRDLPLIRRVELPALFRQTLSVACRHPAEIVSLQKIQGQLQDRGSLNTLADYLDLLAAAFLIEPVRKWSSKPLRVRASTPKLIVRNNALVSALDARTPAESLRDPDWRGRLVENAVGASLINTEHEVYYWNDRDAEVDFVVRQGARVMVVEVKSGRTHKKSASMNAFMNRHSDATPLRIGGSGGDLSLEEFFLHGLS